MRIRYATIALFAGILVGCVASDDEASEQDRLIGSWLWEYSQGGYAADTLLPSRLGYRIALEFADEGSYRAYRNGAPESEGRYRVESGRVFNPGDSIVSIIAFDTSWHFIHPGDPELAIREIGADTLILFDTGSDGYEHVFVRRQESDPGVRR